MVKVKDLVCNDTQSFSKGEKLKLCSVKATIWMTVHQDYPLTTCHSIAYHEDFTPCHAMAGLVDLHVICALNDPS